MTQTTARPREKTTTMVLRGYGRLTWQQARALLDGCACTWTDFDGLHLQDTPPTGLPVAASHLWAWTPAGDRLVRLRFDGLEAVYAAVLTRADTDDGHHAPEVAAASVPVPVLVEEAAVRERGTVLRDPRERSAAALPAEFGEKVWHLVEIPGECPLTFVRVEPSS
ncbi:hypothetical protein ACFZAG_35565 [Streptomyces sp. NPDC012403]|uniref:hypothetical protein n=1 Tax=Streptomyces sp. NPDC012403 TaxID=3364831 RepID=UPI0036EE25B1